MISSTNSQSESAKRRANESSQSDLHKPSLVIVCNSIPPYRIHLHRRVAHEITELKLWTLVTHENRSDRWGYQPTEDIGAVLFGPGEETSQQSRLTSAIHEWHKGGRIIQWIQQHNAKAVVVCGYNDPGRMRIIMWCRRHQIPCFIFGDGNILIDHPRPLKKLIKHFVVKRLLTAATGVLPCGRNGAEFFCRYGARRDRIYWFPYEPDFSEIENLTVEKINHVRQRYGLELGRRRMVFSGRLIQWKRVDMAIDAFAAVAAERNNWDLVIIGDGELKAMLQNRVPHHLKSRVFFLGFIDQQENISAIYRCCDLLIHPANAEQWAIVISEAAAAGLAFAVDQTVGAANELVHNHINGRTFRSNDLADLIACVRDITNSDRIDAMKQASIGILSAWRKVHDPIQGLRRALSDSVVLP